MKKVDARGLSCPEPVIRAKNAMESGDKEYEILVDNVVAKENVSRFATHQGYPAETYKMITYIATFYSHYGAIQFRRNCQAMNLSAEVMPVPRDLSSSCGTCVRFHAEADFPEKTEEVEQIVRVEPQGYVGIYHADEE